MTAWDKLGVIVSPGRYPWMASHAGPSCVDVVDGRVFLYITGRSKDNVSSIGRAELVLDGAAWSIKDLSPTALFDVGELGAFDESGVSYPWLVRRDGRLYMYYVGWVAGGRTGFQNHAGLAVSEDGGRSFRRASRAPILERTDAEPFGSGSACVFLEDGLWKMYYTAFDGWVDSRPKAKPRYNIKLALSSDGIRWRREGRVVVDYKNESETVIGKPMLLKEGGVYKLWYSCRGPAYRIGYAESADGLDYARRDEAVGIGVSAEGWDSEMIEYAFVFDHRGRRYMIYNGNGFGETGLGLAVSGARE
jgi:hypothetical protein